MEVEVVFEIVDDEDFEVGVVQWIADFAAENNIAPQTAAAAVQFQAATVDVDAPAALTFPAVAAAQAPATVAVHAPVAGASAPVQVQAVAPPPAEDAPAPQPQQAANDQINPAQAIALIRAVDEAPALLPAAGDLLALNSNLRRIICPICLDQVDINARVTRCGHIYCYACFAEFERLHRGRLGYIDTIRFNYNGLPCPKCRNPIRGIRNFIIPQTLTCPLCHTNEVNRVVACGHSFCFDCVNRALAISRGRLSHQQQLRFSLNDFMCPICNVAVENIGALFL